MLADEIRSFFHGDVATDDASLAAASRDYSVFKVKPQIVVFPKDVEDVKNLVKLIEKKKAAGENVSLTGRSAGTDMTGGPLGESVIVSFTRFPERGRLHISITLERSRPTMRLSSPACISATSKKNLFQKTCSIRHIQRQKTCARSAGS